MFEIKTLIKTITLVKEENILLIYLYQFVDLYCELNPDRLITCILFGNVFVLSRLTQKTIIEWIKQIGYPDLQTQFENTSSVSLYNVSVLKPICQLLESG